MEKFHNEDENNRRRACLRCASSDSSERASELTGDANEEKKKRTRRKADEEMKLITQTVFKSFSNIRWTTMASSLLLTISLLLLITSCVAEEVHEQVAAGGGGGASEHNRSTDADFMRGFANSIRRIKVKDLLSHEPFELQFRTQCRPANIMYSDNFVIRVNHEGKLEYEQKGRNDSRAYWDVTDGQWHTLLFNNSQIFLDSSRQANIANEDNFFGFDAEPAWLNFISYIDTPAPEVAPAEHHGDKTISFFDGFVGCVRAIDRSTSPATATHHHPKEPSSASEAGTLEHDVEPTDYIEAWLEDDPGHGGNNLTVLFQLFNHFAACSSDLGQDLRESFPCHDPSSFIYCEKCRGKCVEVAGEDAGSNRNECECQKPGMTGKYCDVAPRALPDRTVVEPIRQNYVTESNNTDQDVASTLNNVETHNNSIHTTTADNENSIRSQPSTEAPEQQQTAAECSPPCINGGSCTANRTCACPTGFTGLSCEHVHPAEGAICNGPNSCRNGGKCIEGECYCKPGYTGILCEQDINECDSNPCNATHTSECRNLVNAFECVCLPGYTGSTCAEEIDECESNPCQNGATCVDKVAGYECQCVAGYDGVNCENNIDDCAVMDEEGFPPCKNGGVCHDRLLGYTCDCDDTGFTGQRCEINIDDCQHDKCQHNSTCLDKVKDYSCECLPGYEGKHCETDIDECAYPVEEPACKENGTCYQYSDERLYNRNAWPNRVQPEPFQHEFSFASAAGYYCACPPGFRGARCEENIDECSLKREPCNGHGICKDGRNEYTCECAKGYTGKTCDINIDECESNPCVRGTCEDGIGDYRCLCPLGYGSKNCEVELTACNDDPCENNGTCRAFYENSTHDFACTCPNGYVGKRCEIETTISFNNSYISVVESSNSGLEEADKSKYELKFRFRTTLPNVVIAAGQGLTYFMLTLSDGRLNLQSSLLNSLQGISSGSNLANAEWHSVGISVNSTHIALTANSEQTIHPISENDETQGEGFNTTFLGGAPTTLVTLNRDNYGNFVGCMEDVEINGNSVNRVSITPDSRPQWNVSSPEPITFGCLRRPQCPANNNPCVNNGVCTDLWNTYKCQCVRPYLGSRCVYSYWPATFGHENTTNSMARIDILPEISSKFSNSFEISMFIRTRERKGTVFYLGDESRETGLFLEAAVEEDGGFVVLSKIDDANKEENYNVGGAIINDGYRHLISIQREKGLVKISVNGTEHFRKSVKEKSQFSPVVMFIGGVPPGTDGIEYPYPEDATLFPGGEANTGPPPPSSSSSSNSHAVVRSFKGVIQDVRVNLSQSDHGLQKEGWYVVKFYDQSIPHAMGFPLGNVTLTSGVVKDQVSDDTCRVNPCKNGGVCNVTWNDFTCNCPQDIWSGKTCQVLLRCPQVKCPEGSECRNIGINGFQCVAPAAFNGKTNLSPHYYLDSDEPSNLDFNSISFSYRSRVGGSILDLASRTSNLRIAVERETSGRTDIFNNANASGLITVYLNGSRLSTKMDNCLDGEWHQVHIGIDADRYLVLKFDGVSKGRILGQQLHHTPVSQRLITDIVLAPNATVVVGSHFLEGSEYYTDNEALSDSLHQPVSYDSFYRGCLSDIQIGDFQLPFISQQLLRSTNAEAGTTNLTLVDKTAPTAFYIVPSSNTPELGCVLCYDDECVHGACANAKELYQCSCENGWDGSFCDHNIDECQNNLCAAGSSCVDGIANYTCNCEDGYTGWLCNIDIDECKLYEPCQNGGVCRNYIPEDGKYHCECTPEWIGKNCTQRKHVSCEGAVKPCKKGKCVPIPETSDGLQFRCDCNTGYRGQLCEEEINYCYNKTCYNGGTCINVPSYESTECMCATGYNGPHCEVNIDDCHLHGGEPVCKNNATCIDGIEEYTCDCAGTGFEGPNCDIDIDECVQRSVADQCQRDHGKICRNIPGHFECVCREPYCGAKCNIINPCSLRPSNETCMNGGACRPVCPADEQPSYVCDCNEGFTGTMCHLRSTDRSQTMNIALIVVPVLTAFLLAAVIAIVVLVKMARKKRATRGVYSPSQEEYSNPRVELDNVLKPPPEERLI